MPLAALKKKPASAKPAVKRKPVAAQPILSAPARMQAKLEVGPVGDRFEQEADRTADSVMRMPNPGMSVAAAPLQISRKCAVCEREEKEGKDDKRLQKEPAGLAETSIGAAPASVHAVLRSQGQPLDVSTRAYFEPRFGQEFADVRVHTGMAAARSAREVSAHAYTVGQNIVFAAGRFAPATQTGRRLIAHELTHVVQNFSGSEASVIRRTPGAGAYEIISPIWNVGGRDIVIVQMKADGRTFFFYRRTGLGSKGAFEPTAPSGGKWVPFEGFEEVERLAGTKPVTTYRFHKEPYYYSPAVEEGQVAPGYGTQTNKDIAQWLDNELPPGKVPGKAANWGDVQNQLSKYRARNLPSPGTEAPPKARTVSGEIGGGSTPTGGAAGGKITTESVPPAATTPKPISPMEPQVGMPKPTSPMEAHKGGGPQVTPEARAPANAPPTSASKTPTKGGTKPADVPTTKPKGKASAPPSMPAVEPTMPGSKPLSATGEAAVKTFNGLMNQYAGKATKIATSDPQIAATYTDLMHLMDAKALVEHPQGFAAQKLANYFLDSAFTKLARQLAQQEAAFWNKYPDVRHFHQIDVGSGQTLDSLKAAYADATRDLQKPGARQVLTTAFVMLGLPENAPQSEINKRIAVINAMLAQQPGIGPYAQRYDEAQKYYMIALQAVWADVTFHVAMLDELPKGSFDQIRRRGDLLIDTAKILDELAEKVALLSALPGGDAAWWLVNTVAEGVRGLGEGLQGFASQAGDQRRLYQIELDRLSAEIDHINNLHGAFDVIYGRSSP